MKTALITGVNGMDGSHLVDLLLEKGYHVCGITRSQVTLNEKVTYYRGDINDIKLMLLGMIKVATLIELIFSFLA